MKHRRPQEPLPRRWRIPLGAVLLASALLWTWLYLQAEAVAPETQKDYVRVLRELRDADNTANTNLLASRMELVRNYDALTQLTSQTLALSKLSTHIPNFVQAPERAKVQETALALQKAFEAKAQLIESFKRENSIARNSLAYFPIVGNRLLTRSSGAEREALERYLTDILIYSRTLDPQNSERIAQSRRLLSASTLGIDTDTDNAKELNNLLRHGDAILVHLPRVDQLTRQILALKTDAQVDALGIEYARGRTVAVQRADRYRSLLYVLALLVTAYLVYTFVQLARAQRSLALEHREIHDRYAAQLKAERSLRLHASAFQNAHEGMALTDMKGNILDVNPAFTRITGWSREEVLGKNPRVLRSDVQDDAFYNEMWQTLRRDGIWKGEIWNRLRSGETCAQMLSISCVRDTQGRPTNYVGVFSDISELTAPPGP
jgi:PAS domain S-box-containing protein